MWEASFSEVKLYILRAHTHIYTKRAHKLLWFLSIHSGLDESDCVCVPDEQVLWPNCTWGSKCIKITNYDWVQRLVQYIRCMAEVGPLITLPSVWTWGSHSPNNVARMAPCSDTNTCLTQTSIVSVTTRDWKAFSSLYTANQIWLK